MKTLNCYNDNKEIRQNNIDQAKKTGIYEMAMKIGALMHENNPVERYKWENRSQEDKDAIFSNVACYGAICGIISNGKLRTGKFDNPDNIHVGQIQINPAKKEISFWYETIEMPLFWKPKQIEQFEAILNEYSFTVAEGEKHAYGGY